MKQDLQNLQSFRERGYVDLNSNCFDAKWIEDVRERIQQAERALKHSGWEWVSEPPRLQRSVHKSRGGRPKFLFNYIIHKIAKKKKLKNQREDRTAIAFLLAPFFPDQCRDATKKGEIAAALKSSD